MIGGFPSPNCGFPALDEFAIVCPAIAFPMVVEVLTVCKRQSLFFNERDNIINSRACSTRDRRWQIFNAGNKTFCKVGSDGIWFKSFENGL